MEEKKVEEKPESLILVERAEAAAKRLEEANKQNELLATKLTLGGRAAAGTPAAPKPSKEEEIKARVNKLLQGTGMKI